MTESKPDLILHPVRMRIIGLLVGGTQLTAREMSEALSDVPIASLYRHLSKLVEGEIVSVISENRVRGTLEKIYALPEQNGNVTQEDLASATREDHMRYFMTFLASLFDDFDRYLQHDSYDMLRDGVGYRQVPLYLSDEEFHTFVTRSRELFTEFLTNKPSPERRRRTFTTITISEPACAKDQDGE